MNTATSLAEHPASYANEASVAEWSAGVLRALRNDTDWNTLHPGHFGLYLGH